MILRSALLGAPRSALAAVVRAVVRAVVLGLLAFAIFGPIANMLLWAVAEAWYFPHKLPVEWGFSFWERVFRPQGNAMESLVNSVLIASRDGGREPRHRDPGRARPRAGPPPVAGASSCSCSCCRRLSRRWRCT